MAAMETKNNVLAGNISTEEGERSSRRVQQPAVWSLGLSRRWPVPLVLMIGSAGIDMPAHAGHGIGCVGCNSSPWGRPGSHRVARSSAGAREWSGSERSVVHVALVPRGLHGAHLGLPMCVVREHEHCGTRLEACLDCQCHICAVWALFGARTHRISLVFALEFLSFATHCQCDKVSLISHAFC